MIIYFRVDSSSAIGNGHAIRSFALAEKLRARGAMVRFICGTESGHINMMYKEKGFEVISLPTGIEIEEDKTICGEILKKSKEIPSWLIIDNYGIDFYWEKSLRPFVKAIMVIDDLANRRHDCDLLLDQNLYVDMKKRYDGLVPEGCKRFVGQEYVLLREEFFREYRWVRGERKETRNLLVTFGGGDPTKETQKTIRALSMLQALTLETDIIVGSSNPYFEEIREMARNLVNVEIHHGVETMSRYIAKADLAVGSIGLSTWERCYLGLPSISISITKNQEEIALAIAEAGVTYYMGNSLEVTSKQIAAAINKIIGDPMSLQQLSEKALTMMDTEKLCHGADMLLEEIMKGSI
jgi:UDP-2,4-diacetamido-2,4,6-trideoxy-beta-L-altropyranose hydrolase